MRRPEIKRKFDDIVAFAEVEKFLDTPVKRYSSGMYMRLAFAVAAHLEPDILIVDEVLAVGDAGFQRRCIGRMSTIAEAGRTVFLVSHQLNQIRRLCDWCIWLDSGRVRSLGPTVRVLSDYESSLAGRPAAGKGGRRDDEETATRFLSWEIMDPRAEEPHVLGTFEPVTVRFLLHVAAPIRHGHQGIALFNQDRQLIWATAVDPLVLEPGVHALAYTFPSLPLRPGPYQWHISINDDGRRIDDWFAHPDLVIATPPITHPQERFQGVLNLPWTFDTRPL
jgi:lipopolysaccharide transport system ATP-binding protein